MSPGVRMVVYTTCSAEPTSSKGNLKKHESDECSGGCARTLNEIAPVLSEHLVIDLDAKPRFCQKQLPFRPGHRMTASTVRAFVRQRPQMSHGNSSRPTPGVAIATCAPSLRSLFPVPDCFRRHVSPAASRDAGDFPGGSDSTALTDIDRQDIRRAGPRKRHRSWSV